MNWRVRQTEQFKSDFREVLRYIYFELRNPTAAEALVEEFDAVVKRVAAFPRLSAAYPTQTEHAAAYRTIQVKNYLAFYVVLEDTVEFRRFLYGRADLPRRLPF